MRGLHWSKSSCALHVTCSNLFRSLSMQEASLSLRRLHNCSKDLLEFFGLWHPACSQSMVLPRYDLAADVWSFGILLEELTLGRAPYANMSLTSVILTTLNQDAPTLCAQKSKRKFSEVRSHECCRPFANFAALAKLESDAWELRDGFHPSKAAAADTLPIFPPASAPKTWHLAYVMCKQK